MIEKIARKANLLRYSFRASKRFQQSLIGTLRRALTLYRDRRFLAEEAFDVGLFKLDCDPTLLREAVSRRYQAQVQKRLNPISWAPLLADKGIFYRYCEARGLPIPDLYAVFFRGTPGYCPAGTPLYNSRQWAGFVASGLPTEFVVKPCGSYRGRGVLGYTRIAADHFLASDGVARSSSQIVDSLRNSHDADNFVIQQRLRSHQAIAALSQNSNLQTLRITTFIGRDGMCRMLFAHLKLMTDAKVFTDNVGDGQAGNICSVICLETGRIAKTFVKTWDGSGDRFVSNHPVTRCELAGFPIPRWSDACDLARRAAYAFLPVRSVGWDVGITDDGVKLIEGNIWWDRRDYADGYMAVLLNDLDGL